MKVSVVYALPSKFWSVTVCVREPATVSQVLELAKLDAEFVAVKDVAIESIAVWGQKVDLNDAVVNGDRIEILRPLEQHPMERRRRLANKGQLPAK